MMGRGLLCALQHASNDQIRDTTKMTKLFGKFLQCVVNHLTVSQTIYLQ